MDCLTSGMDGKVNVSAAIFPRARQIGDGLWIESTNFAGNLCWKLRGIKERDITDAALSFFERALQAFSGSCPKGQIIPTPVITTLRRDISNVLVSMSRNQRTDDQCRTLAAVTSTHRHERLFGTILNRSDDAELGHLGFGCLVIEDRGQLAVMKCQRACHQLHRTRGG